MAHRREGDYRLTINPGSSQSYALEMHWLSSHRSPRLHIISYALLKSPPHWIEELPGPVCRPFGAGAACLAESIFPYRAKAADFFATIHEMRESIDAARLPASTRILRYWLPVVAML